MAILRGEILVGMGGGQVQASWGVPSSRFWVAHDSERWEYRERGAPLAFVYFEEGLVKGWRLFR